jgi:hypothetical protein
MAILRFGVIVICGFSDPNTRLHVQWFCFYARGVHIVVSTAYSVFFVLEAQATMSFGWIVQL